MQKHQQLLLLITLVAIIMVWPKVYSQESTATEQARFTIAFGSCNKQYKPQPLWEDIMKQDPDLFIWTGDNIYADTADMQQFKKAYDQQLQNPGYQKLLQTTPVIGVWDDHDYGKNDAGAEWKMKQESQQLFLDFFAVDEDDERRDRAGIYTSKIIEKPGGSIKIILLDTRYFRSPLVRDRQSGKRYQPTTDPSATVLGATQWQWLAKEIANNYSDFMIIVSSIQYLSGEHEFESWSNFPKERNKMMALLEKHKARNVIFLSGDRHISEFSVYQPDGLSYPLVDFTSSGLTHDYTDFTGESNRHRVGKVIAIPSFGLLKFDLTTYQVTMEMRGKDNLLLQSYRKTYPK
ncbi:alkaline phosphatase D family protein [Aquimarina brevivitae]|nr:alkaline phosphatase D family protein [Aquimarina brevivitae]